MTDRQSQFLRQLVDYYVATAEPVASGLLAASAEVSSATVRNDMAELEEQGYIVQPHTSAGRIPTSKGYRFYIENFASPVKPSASHKKQIERALQTEHPLKDVAKVLAEQTNQAVFVARSLNDFYYTGLSKLFSHPEFAHHQQVVNISSVLDILDSVIEELYQSVSDQVEIVFGDDNPFSEQCSLIVSKVDTKGDEPGVIVILGPARMDYNKCVGLLEFVGMIIDQRD